MWFRGMDSRKVDPMQGFFKWWHATMHLNYPLSTTFFFSFWWTGSYMICYKGFDASFFRMAAAYKVSSGNNHKIHSTFLCLSSPIMCTSTIYLPCQTVLAISLVACNSLKEGPNGMVRFTDGWESWSNLKERANCMSVWISGRPACAVCTLSGQAIVVWILCMTTDL